MYICQFIIKETTQEEPKEEPHRVGDDGGRGWRFHALWLQGCPSSLMCPPPRKLPESHRAGVLWSSTSIPLSLLGGQWMGWGNSSPLTTLSVGWPAPSREFPPWRHLININSGTIKRGSVWITKDTPIAQETPRVWGALCQGQRTKTKYVFYYTRMLYSFCLENFPSPVFWSRSAGNKFPQLLFVWKSLYIGIK